MHAQFRGRARAAIWAGITLLTWVASRNALAQHYLTADLGVLNERNSGGADINLQGQVCGASSITGGFWILPDGTIYGEAWLPHACLWTDGEILDLGVLGNDPPPGTMPRPQSAAYSLNSAGQIVGETNQPSEEPQAFLWLPEPAYGLPAGMHRLPPLSATGIEVTRAHALNDAGVIVGESQGGPTNPPPPRAVKWEWIDEAWQIFDLGTLDGRPENAARARAVNALGQAVGYSNNVPYHNSLEPCLWLPEPAYGLPAGANALDPAHGGGDAVAINDLGQIIGHLGASSPFLWLPEPAYGLPAGLNVLDPYPHPTVEWTKFTDINNNGQIVGYFRYTVDGIFHEVRAFVWEQGAYRLIDDLLPPYSRWSVHKAQAINDAGQITGSMESDMYVFQGLWMGHAMVLTPALLGDIDDDHDRDWDDFITWTQCVTGPDLTTPPLAVTPEQFHRADLQGDSDVDLGDFASLQTVWADP